MPSACWPASIPRRCRRHRGPPMNWSIAGHRDAAAAHEAARAALARAERAAPSGPHPVADGRSRKRMRRARRAGRAVDCARQEKPSAARRGRGPACLEGARRRCLPSRRLPCRQGGLARHAPGAVRAGARTLAEASPGDASRATLLARAFRARHADESHRARLRVEIGRLRKSLARFAEHRRDQGRLCARARAARATSSCSPRRPTKTHAAVLALLADGEAWSSSALALALGASQRTVQRALDELAAAEQGTGGRQRPRAALDGAAACRDSRQACYSRPRCPVARLSAWELQQRTGAS